MAFGGRGETKALGDHDREAADTAALEVAAMMTPLRLTIHVLLALRSLRSHLVRVLVPALQDVDKLVRKRAGDQVFGQGQPLVLPQPISPREVPRQTHIHRKETTGGSVEGEIMTGSEAATITAKVVGFVAEIEQLPCLGSRHGDLEVRVQVPRRLVIQVQGLEGPAGVEYGEGCWGSLRPKDTLDIKRLLDIDMDALSASS